VKEIYKNEAGKEINADEGNSIDIIALRDQM
jgi:hypothetical protein